MSDRISTQEAARRLGFSVTHVLRLLKGAGGCRKRLDGVQTASGEWLIDSASVTQFQLYRGLYRFNRTFRDGYVSIQEAAERCGQERNAMMLGLLTTLNGSALEWFGDTPMVRESIIQGIENPRKEG